MFSNIFGLTTLLLFSTFDISTADTIEPTTDELGVTSEGRTIVDEIGANISSTIAAIDQLGENELFFAVLNDAAADKVQFELDTWKAPHDMRKHYAYYHSGYDEDDRPIWVCEVGKWDLRIFAETNDITRRTFNKYLAQVAHRIIKSIKERTSPDNPVTDGILILDMDGFDLVKLAHVPTISALLDLLRQFGRLIGAYLYLCIFVNLNAAAHGLINLARPIAGSLLNKAEFYGTNPAHYIPRILRHCPKNQIPPWYGGNKDFKPVQIYG